MFDWLLETMPHAPSWTWLEFCVMSFVLMVVGIALYYNGD